MEFEFVTDKEKYYTLKGKHDDSAAFASPWWRRTTFCMPLIHEKSIEYMKEEAQSVRELLIERYPELGKREDLLKKMEACITIPFANDLYLNNIVHVIDHEVFHVLLHEHEEIERIFLKEDRQETEHKIIEQLSKDICYTWRWGKEYQPINLARYVESF